MALCLENVEVRRLQETIIWRRSLDLKAPSVRDLVFYFAELKTENLSDPLRTIVIQIKQCIFEIE